MWESTDLIKRTTVLELVTMWNQSKADLKEGYTNIEKAKARLKLFGDRTDHSLERYDEEAYNDKIGELQTDVWRALIDRLEVRKVLSIKKAKELDYALNEGKMPDGTPLPEITEDGIYGLAQSFATNVESFMEEAVKEVFEFLRPHRSHYKTNTEFEIGKRVNLSWWVESNYSGGYRVTYSRDAEVRALENVFRLLDGKGTSNSHFGELADAIKSGKTESTYFKFRCYKNRSLHLTFKRMDLVRKLNAIAGGMNLRKAV